MANNSKLIRQLRILTELTQAEAQIAQTRVAQARTDAVRRELTQNAENAAKRTELLLQAVRDLGGVPDVLSPVIGRFTGAVKAVIEQPQPLDEALLGDLALEHQLLDRARYVKALAEADALRATARLADRLITAHTATVEWLTVVLAEDALGGPAALRATPVQRLAGTASQVVNLPASYMVEAVNRTVEGVQQSTGQTRILISTMAGKASQFSGAVRETLTVGRNSSLARAERIAREDGDAETADTVHKSRRNLGALTATELPIDDYDTLNVADAVKAIKALEQAADVQAVIAYEEAHAARARVVSAAQTRVAAIAKQVVGIV